MSELAQGITKTDDGEYKAADGTTIDSATAESFLAKSSRESWMLGKDEAGELAAIASAKHASELSNEQRQLVREAKADTMEPEAMAFKRLQKQAAERLDLSKELTDAKTKEDLKRSTDSKNVHQAKGAEHRSNHEKLLADKMSAELSGVSKKVEAEVLAKEMAKAETALAEEAKRNPDKINLHYAKKQFEADAKKAAKEAGQAAASERKVYIEANGGAAAISRINREEKEAADKEAFLDRLHGGNRPGTKTKEAKDLPDFAKLERPDDVDYKDWLNMSNADRKAVAAPVTEPTVDVEPDIDGRPSGVPKDVWDTLSDDEKARAIAADTGADAKPTKDVADDEPVTNGSPKGLRARLNHRMLEAGVRLMNAKTRAGEYFNDEEKGKPRKVVVGAVVGAVALVGSAYLATKMGGGSGSGFSRAHELAQPRGGGSAAAGNVLSEILPQGIPLPKGGTVWELASEHLGGRPSNQQIFEETQRILDLNHINWEQARHLVEGTEIVM